MPNLFRISVILVILTLAVHSHARDVISGKVVGVSDGDTITVLENRNQHIIRLYGIDAPEGGNRAKKFVSDLEFGKQVRLVQMDIHRYQDSSRRITVAIRTVEVRNNKDMIGHQRPCKTRRLCIRQGIAERIQEIIPVAVINKTLYPIDSPHNDAQQGP